MCGAAIHYSRSAALVSGSPAYGTTCANSDTPRRWRVGLSLDAMTAGIHRMRRVETGLTWATIVALLIYAPVETIYSWPGLTDPFYVIDVIGMALMMSGVVRSLRARPGSGAAMLAVGWAWTASNFWRATFDRVE